MRRMRHVLAATAFAALGTLVAFAQAPQQPAGGAPAQGQPGGGGRGGPQGPASFFITSVGKGDGANYGGIAGADAYCAQMAKGGGLETPAGLLTPAHHSPFGMSLHPTRRTAVVDWAQRTDGYVFDDDYDGEFRYDRQPIGALPALCPDRVVYLGSASKSLSQALRLGWMVVPDSLIDAVMAAAGGQQFYVDAVAQLTMADFISAGSHDKHIRRMRMRYRRRRDALVEALSGFDVGISGLSAGVNIVLTLPDGAEHEVLRRAGEAGIALQGLSIMRHPLAGRDVPDPDGIIVGFAAPADHAFTAAVGALLDVLKAAGLAR